jgi:CRP/FNR family transcriptional regulator
VKLDCASCPVRETAACSSLSEQERTALARAGRTRLLKRGETLFAAGDDNDACATLIEGALKIAGTDEDGTEHILALIHPAGFVGELFQPFAHHDVVALTESRLCVFARSEMEDALRRHPALAQALLRRSQEDLHESRKLMALSTRRGASEKVAALLVELAQAASQSSCHPAVSFDLPLTRGEIAALLGLTIETVSRSLTALEDDGLIRRKGARGNALADPARLEEKAGAAPQTT